MHPKPHSRVGFCPKKSLGHAEAHRIIQYPTEKGKRKVNRTTLGNSKPPAITSVGGLVSSPSVSPQLLPLSHHLSFLTGIWEGSVSLPDVLTQKHHYNAETQRK